MTLGKLKRPLGIVSQQYSIVIEKIMLKKESPIRRVSRRRKRQNSSEPAKRPMRSDSR